ncbi:Prenylated Rab acceptor 1 [Vermiconidia calcicola]|uniref:Prenylated Rab acceptor 1 n=1 Tax=Vermiconidia calcicola TaxID=1690605 RepID=A0ACC3MQ56_9PEZI|nr:Prenylated Rab acceptor 1 [Vermiconidia calcicola]
MARINIPLDALTSRLNLQGRFDSVKSQSIANRFANLKPISEFFDLKRLSKPRDFGDVQNRVNYNLSYFSSNYAVLFVMLSIYSLLTNLLLLFVIILVVGGMFGIGKLQGRDLDVGFARATTSQLYTGLLIIAVPLGIWASPISTVLWLIGATGVSILGHASFMEKDIASSFSEEAVSIPMGKTLPWYRRSAAPSLPYDTGRPPGALDRGGVRRRYMQQEDWELRDPRRFEELYSDEEEEEEDEDGQGVILDPNSYAARDARARGGFQSDELYFDGYDIGRDRKARRGVYDQASYGQEFDSDELDYRDRRGLAFQTAVRDKEEVLIQSALARIARARAKGKTNVNLTQEEMEALERRRSQQPEPAPPLASPPVTPAKPAAKGSKVSSRSNSSTNLASQKGRKRGSSSLFGTGSPSPAKSNSKAKVERKSSAERALQYPTGHSPAGVLVPGPDGQPVYAPVGYYGPPSPEYSRTQSGSRPGSRSASKHSRRESTPPERTEAYAQYPLRYYPPSGVRPPSSGSNRSLPDDIDWYPPPPPPRKRSASNAQYIGNHPAADYDNTPPPLPAVQGRRNVSGPPDVRYSPLRRVAPLATARPAAAHAYSEPTMAAARKGSGLSREVDGGSSSASHSSSDDQGVQIEIVPDVAGGSGYSINRAPAPALASGNEGRRRRSGRR